MLGRTVTAIGLGRREKCFVDLGDHVWIVSYHVLGTLLCMDCHGLAVRVLAYELTSMEHVQCLRHGLCRTRVSLLGPRRYCKIEIL